MSVLDLVREDLRGFAGYSSARKEASGGRVLLNANESPWSVAGDALALNRYPDPQPAALIERLSALYGVPADRLLVGRGSDEAIDLMVRALCKAGEGEVLVSPPTFGMYQVCARVQGAAVSCVPLRAEDDFALDVEAVLAALTPATRIVFVCSPNNPTGGSVPRASLERLVEALRGRALLVIDEAYAEFSEAAEGIALALAHEHVAVLRTLSKAYALAGARIGTLIAAPELIRVLRAIMAPYPLPTPSVDAALKALTPGALALARSRIGLIREERRRLAAALPGLPGVRRVLDSEANFLAVEFDDAAPVYRAALAAGIVLRAPNPGNGLDRFLRVSIGTPAENDALLTLLQSWREAA
ncbi:histidinol-phosphate transaminase [Pseudomarimonas salicorniae]|uniref:Histidinol-phosphate aminotransferase n=1 Tax=Pseudomarimonas salicorniae TaxID=2933270 RepID=A0ABT0GLI0_9GAMM|nr:histidinol-phosphate transaminase [Lysobacter sp. CAU 1642]MCK7595401.1 histidinol-phosphate transaminase [Lysobacter sp. CAU 1642]